MKIKSIKKIGHCCLVVDCGDMKIMTDPGSYSTAQTAEMNIAYIIISHEHGDHIHVESLKKVLENNSNAKIITNNSVKKLLDKENCLQKNNGESVECIVLENGEMVVGGLNIFAKTVPHVDIYDTVPVVDNTAYFINSELLYPGDAWVEIEKPVPILALPVSGPWCKIRDCLEYALKINPKIAFPVHDGMLKENGKGMVYGLPTKVLGEKGIEFKKLTDGESLEF